MLKWPRCKDRVQVPGHDIVEVCRKYHIFLHSSCFIRLIVSFAEGLLQLLQQIGKAYVALSQYECAKAVSLFSALPPQHYNTGWVMCQVGRAYFEMAEYEKVSSILDHLGVNNRHRIYIISFYVILG